MILASTCRRVDQQRVGINVGEDRRSAQIGHAVGRGGEGDGRHDHLVAGADAQGVHGRVQGGRPVADGHGSRRAGDRGQRPLELGHLRTGRQPIRPQHLDHGGNVRLVDRLPAVGQQRPPDRASRRQWPVWLFTCSSPNDLAAARRRTSKDRSCRWYTRSLRPTAVPSGTSGRSTTRVLGQDDVLAVDPQRMPRLVAREHHLVQLLAGPDADELDFALRGDGRGQVHDLHAGNVGHEDLAAVHLARCSRARNARLAPASARSGSCGRRSP